MVIKTLKKKKKEEMYWFHYISSFILFTLLVDNFFKTQKLTIHTRGRKKQERKKKKFTYFWWPKQEADKCIQQRQDVEEESRSKGTAEAEILAEEGVPAASPCGKKGLSAAVGRQEEAESLQQSKRKKEEVFYKVIYILCLNSQDVLKFNEQ